MGKSVYHLRPLNSPPLFHRKELMHPPSESSASNKIYAVTGGGKYTKAKRCASFRGFLHVSDVQSRKSSADEMLVKMVIRGGKFTGLFLILISEEINWSALHPEHSGGK